MKNSLIIFTLHCFVNCFGQNVKLEISNYHRKLDEKVFATYQYANSSYSGFRPTIVFITNKNLLMEISSKLNSFYTVKQEYTDVWILGITDFDNKNLSESDKKIIEVFLTN